MSKKTGPLQIVDGVWYSAAHPGDRIHIEHCCDCGLAHRIEYKIDGGRIYYRYTVDQEETDKERKRLGIVKEVKAVIKKRKDA